MRRVSSFIKNEYLIASFSLAILVLGAGWYWRDRLYLRVIHELYLSDRLIAALSYPFLIQNNHEKLREAMGPLAAEYSQSYVLIIDRNRTIIFAYPKIELVNTSVPTEWRLFETETQVVRRYLDGQVVETNIPIRGMASDVVGYAVVGTNDKSIYKKVNRYFYLFLVTGAFCVVSLISLIYLIRRRFERAFVRFGRQIESIAAGEFVPISSDSSDPKSWKELMAHFNKILEQYLEKEKQLVNSQRMAAVAEVAAAAAHDIRSPLTALDIIAKDISELSEKKKLLIQNAVSRIHDIANGLLSKSRKLSGSSSKPILMQKVLDYLITEKRMQHGSKAEIRLRLDPSAYGAFTSVTEPELMRIISNIIDNAVEAMSQKGIVDIGISLDSTTRQILILVQDNGKGMSPEVLKKIGQRGATFDKLGGSGLGVYQAISLLDSIGGSLEIQSQMNQGTQVEIRIPRTTVPDWFATELAPSSGAHWVILDNDNSIHRAWEQKLDMTFKNKKAPKFTVYSEIENFMALISEHKNLSSLFLLIDYELSTQSKTGLDLIEELNLSPYATLVTSRFDDEKIQERARALGTKILPKELIHLVPIRIRS